VHQTLPGHFMCLKLTFLACLYTCVAGQARSLSETRDKSQEFFWQGIFLYYRFVVISMASSMTWWNFSRLAVSALIQIIYLWVTSSIVVTTLSRPSCFFWRLKYDTRSESLSSEETTSHVKSPRCTVFMTSVFESMALWMCGDTALKYSIIFHWLQSSITKFSVSTVAYRHQFQHLMRSEPSTVNRKCLMTEQCAI